MQDIITSFIIQSKECKLPGIGKFRLVITSAEPDIANKQILPPKVEFLFTGKEEKISDELIKYVAEKKNAGISEALDGIKNWCAETRSRLKNGEEIILKCLGSLKKGPSGNILFHQNTIQFFEPVAAERVVHENSDHEVLVGDRKTTSSAMNQFYHEEETEVKNSAWKTVALVLLAIALLWVIIYFYQHPFSATGNGAKILPQSPPATYSVQ